MKLLITSLATIMTLSAFAIDTTTCPAQLKIELEKFSAYKKYTKIEEFEKFLIPLKSFMLQDELTLKNTDNKKCIYSAEDVVAIIYTKKVYDAEDGQTFDNDMLKVNFSTDGIEYATFFNIIELSKNEIKIHTDMPGKINKKVYTVIPELGSTALGMINYKISVK